MQQPQSQPIRTRAVLAGITALALSTALTACGSGGTPAADAKAGGSAGASAAAAAPSAAASSAPPKETKVVMPTGLTADLKKSRDTKAGPIMMTTLAGPKSGVSANVWVWLPPQYNDPKYARFGFPVLTLYAGGQSNGYNTWTDNQLPIQEIDAQLVQEQKAHPFIMIMPVQNLTADEHRSLDCSDIPGQPKMGTWLSQDVPDFVRANFRTLKGPASWGLMGASSGADCSAKLAMQHPDLYRAAVPIDGGFKADSLLWKGHKAEQDANSPDKLISTGKADVRMLATAAAPAPTRSTWSRSGSRRPSRRPPSSTTSSPAASTRPWTSTS
ncbi:alpha/beta hydrolase [Kitasatospora gansuensis]